MKEGDGVRYYTDNSIYNGRFYRNERHGLGSLTLQDGTIVFEGKLCSSSYCKIITVLNEYLTLTCAFIILPGEWVEDRRGDMNVVSRLTSMDNINNFYKEGGGGRLHDEAREISLQSSASQR